ncbi:MAG: YqaA family protein [Maricaulaceae bacterium]
MTGHFAFLERWYESIKSLARHRSAERWLAFVAFIESSFFPIPVDAMLIPMVQSNHARWWRYALTASVFSVLGGVFGYVIGLFFFDTLAQPVLEWLGKTEKMDEFSAKIKAYGGIGVFGAGLTPFPYKVITIMSGALKINFAVFMAASVLARSLRFFLVAGAVRLFGDRAERMLKEHFGLMTVVLFALCAALWYIMHAVGG